MKLRLRGIFAGAVLCVALVRVGAGLLVEEHFLQPKLRACSGPLESEITYEGVSFGFLSPSIEFEGLKIPQPKGLGPGLLLEAREAGIGFSWWDLPDQRCLSIEDITLSRAVMRGTVDGSGRPILALLWPAIFLGGGYNAEGHYVPVARYRIGQLELEGTLRLEPGPAFEGGAFVLENLVIEGEDLHNLPDGPEGALSMSALLDGSTINLKLENWQGFDDIVHAATGKLGIHVPSLPLMSLNPLMWHHGAQAEFTQGTLDISWNLELEKGVIKGVEAPVAFSGVRLNLLDPASAFAPLEPWLRMTGGAFSAPLPISGTLEKPRIGFTTFDMLRLLRR